jgi:hypothetical protein
MTTATIDPFTTTTEHPVLIEYTETHLVWIAADTPEDAAALAAKDFGDYYEPDATPVDQSTGSKALDAELAYWLDADAESVEKLDAYFAEHGSRR